MEIIPCTHGNHSIDPWKSIEDNGNKGYGNYSLNNVIISIDAWNSCTPSIQWKFPLDTWKHFHGRL
jgi:hypothetical protein